MTTNPTPLTAEEFDDIEELTHDVLDYFLREIWGKKTVSVIHFYGLGGQRYTRHPVIDLFKAYAAQQNAVAEGQVKVTNLLLDRANSYIDELEAENERLKQQLEWQPIPEDPKEGDKIFAVTSMRPQPEWFFWDTQKYNKAPKPFWHNLQSGVNWSRLYPPTAHFVVPQPPKEGV